MRQINVYNPRENRKRELYPGRSSRLQIFHQRKMAFIFGNISQRSSNQDYGVEDTVHWTVLTCEDTYCPSRLGIEKQEEIKNSPHISAIEYRINRRPGGTAQGFRQRHWLGKVYWTPKSSVHFKMEQPTESWKTSSVSERPFTEGWERIWTDCMYFSPAQICNMLARAGDSLFHA